MDLDKMHLALIEYQAAVWASGHATGKNQATLAADRDRLLAARRAYLAARGIPAA